MFLPSARFERVHGAFLVEPSLGQQLRRRRAHVNCRVTAGGITMEAGGHFDAPGFGPCILGPSRFCRLIERSRASAGATTSQPDAGYCKQQRLYFLPVPHGHGSLRPTERVRRRFVGEASLARRASQYTWISRTFGVIAARSLDTASGSLSFDARQSGCCVNARTGASSSLISICQRIRQIGCGCHKIEVVGGVADRTDRRCDCARSRHE